MSGSTQYARLLEKMTHESEKSRGPTPNAGARAPSAGHVHACRRSPAVASSPLIDAKIAGTLSTHPAERQVFAQLIVYTITAQPGTHSVQRMHGNELAARTQGCRDPLTDGHQCWRVEVAADFTEYHQIERATRHLAPQILTSDFDAWKIGAPFHRTARSRQ
jgi:hypothetical protein